MNRFKEISMGIAAMLIVPAISINASPNNIAGKPTSPATEVMQQQTQITVKGRVTDSADEPLAGASVQIQGTGQGVITNADGNYTIAAKQGAILKFSYIGCKPQSVKVTKAQINVQMEEDANMLNEVVVTEFGLKRVQRGIGSSVQKVTADEIAESGRDNFITALQGRVSGMNVVSSSGAPGASTQVTLRSITSLSGSNQPLYVVDGIPMNNSSFSASSGMAVDDVYDSRTLDFSSRGNDFNPEDIENITVLKGAAAAALYGSNASNGAIIITTKNCLLYTSDAADD